MKPEYLKQALIEGIRKEGRVPIPWELFQLMFPVPNIYQTAEERLRDGVYSQEFDFDNFLAEHDLTYVQRGVLYVVSGERLSQDEREGSACNHIVGYRLVSSDMVKQLIYLDATNQTDVTRFPFCPVCGRRNPPLDAT